MIREYFKMKKNEWKVKAQLYGFIAAFMDNQTEVIELTKSLYEALKDVSQDELQEMFVSKVVELANKEK